MKCLLRFDVMMKSESEIDGEAQYFWCFVNGNERGVWEHRAVLKVMKWMILYMCMWRRFYQGGCE